MNAEGSALPNQPVQKQGRLLSDAVVFDKEQLKLIDDQQDSRHDGLGIRHAVVRQILDTCGAEALAAPFQFSVQPLQDAQAEFSLAFDGDQSSMRQSMRSIRFELHTLLKI